MKTRFTFGIAGIVLAGGMAAGSALAQSTVTVGSYGGDWGEAFRIAALEPIAKELGITIRQVSYNSVSEVKLQVDAGVVSIDIADLAAADCILGGQQNLFESLDYGVIDKTRVPEEFAREKWIIGPTYYSTVMAFRTDAFGGNNPQSWADFWDVERFPGTRALWNYPVSMLEIALMADGVAPDKLYPLDVDRAFAKLREIKPHVTVWWSSGGQSAQLLADGEADMLAMWNGRAAGPIKDGVPAAYTFNQGLLGFDCLAIPRGSPNAELAMKVINRILSPEIQANFPLHINYGPVNDQAFKKGLIDEERWPSINSSPQNIAVQAVQNDDYWAENLARIQLLWDSFMQE